MEDFYAHPSLLTPHLRTRVTVMQDRIACFIPETRFNLIPIGTTSRSQPLAALDKVSVKTKVEESLFLIGELFVVFGIGLFRGGLGLLAIGSTLVGVALLLDSVRAQLIILDASGSTLIVPISYLDSETARAFARTVNTFLISRANMARQPETGTKLAIVVNMPTVPVAQHALIHLVRKDGTGEA